MSSAMKPNPASAGSGDCSRLAEAPTGQAMSVHGSIGSIRHMIAAPKRRRRTAPLGRPVCFSPTTKRSMRANHNPRDHGRSSAPIWTGRTNRLEPAHGSRRTAIAHPCLSRDHAQRRVHHDAAEARRQSARRLAELAEPRRRARRPVDPRVGDTLRRLARMEGRNVLGELRRPDHRRARLRRHSEARPRRKGHSQSSTRESHRTFSLPERNRRLLPPAPAAWLTTSNSSSLNSAAKATPFSLGQCRRIRRYCAPHFHVDVSPNKKYGRSRQPAWLWLRRRRAMRLTWIPKKQKGINSERSDQDAAEVERGAEGRRQ